MCSSPLAQLSLAELKQNGGEKSWYCQAAISPGLSLR